MLEAAFVLPIILLVSIGIFEFGRAYQTMQVITNAAREGARVAVLPNTTADDVRGRVNAYLESGQLASLSSAMIEVDQTASISIGTENASASTVTVKYPFEFMVMQQAVNLVTKKSKLGDPLTLTAKAEMRNESN